mmetsp:Transcript_35777/g.75337  ORF Transcript_35777/g.75337 Transcript_35777/m.75337 type:complete len:102 (-) Transcript_35777:17-322(-)
MLAAEAGFVPVANAGGVAVIVSKAMEDEEDDSTESGRRLSVCSAVRDDEVAIHVEDVSRVAAAVVGTDAMELIELAREADGGMATSKRSIAVYDAGWGQQF